MSADWYQGLHELLLRGAPRSQRRARMDDLRRGYRRPPSFSQLLPWLELLEDDSVLLDDGHSVAAVLELSPVAVEGHAADFLQQLRVELTRVLVEAFPEHRVAPWIMQLYALQDASGLDRRWRRLSSCGEQRAEGAYRDYFLDLFSEHLAMVQQPGGLFEDPLTGRAWRGCHPRVLVCIYRRHVHRIAPAAIVDRCRELSEQLERLGAQLQSAGVRWQRLKGEEIRAWLRGWLSPRGDAVPLEPLAGGHPADYSLADEVCSRDIRSDAAQKTWHFDGVAHCVMRLQRLAACPVPGQISAEHMAGERVQCLVEQLPEGSVLTLTLVFSPQDALRAHLDRIDQAAVGGGAEVVASREAALASRHLLLRGAKIYPFALAIFLRAVDAPSLARRQRQVDALLSANRLQLLRHDLDPTALDAYLCHLPMAYRHHLDPARRQGRLIYANDAAALLPLYGRSTGSDRPGLLFFNRGGDLFSCDPLSLSDRAKNAHLLLIGPTGAGKSATLVYLQMLLMAFHRPRIIAVEAGDSFALLRSFFDARGLSSHEVVLRPGSGASLPPFVGAEQLGERGGTSAEGRDLLGELSLIARLMITGGQEREEQAFSRADEASLQQALLHAAGRAATAGGTVSVSDLCDVLRTLASEGDARRAFRLREMAAALSLFTTGFSGELFDRPGVDWPQVDYLRFEMAVLAGEGYQEQLAVAYLGLLNAVISLAERSGRDGRPTILLTDEAHVLTTNPLISSYIVKVSKLLGRRLGLWLWLATQNLRDFPGDAEKMLSMFEWWLCLQLGQGELREMERFRQLSVAERTLLLSVRKSQGNYTEGVILADTVRARFRNVLPALCLALAQTEKEEKSHRQRVMEERGCTELEAVFHIAECILAARRAEPTP